MYLDVTVLFFGVIPFKEPHRRLVMLLETSRAKMIKWITSLSQDGTCMNTTLYESFTTSTLQRLPCLSHKIMLEATRKLNVTVI